MRLFAAIFQRTPRPKTLFKHRDIDLYIEVVRSDGTGPRAPVDIRYGVLDDSKEFVPLKGKMKRTLSSFQLHYRYDEC